MKISKQMHEGREYLVVDEDPGFREGYERFSGSKFPMTRTYKSKIDGHLQSWWLVTPATEMLLHTLQQLGL